MRAARQAAANPRWQVWVREHGLPLLLLALLSVGLTWPLASHFTTHFASDGTDARHNLWVLWHTKEALLGQEPLFHTTRLYFPQGISLQIHAMGPVMGLIALPFWLFSPEAAYNGALGIGFWLTGYGMYLLARSLGFRRDLALFAGVYYLTTELHLDAMLGHLEKTFLGLLPLALLAGNRTLTPGTSRWWPLVTALILLLTVLHTGWQFVLSALGIAFLGVVHWWRGSWPQRRAILPRVALLGVASLLLVGPFLVTTLRATRNPALDVAKFLESYKHQPDLIEFFVPSRSNWLFGHSLRGFLESVGVPWSIEATISLSWTGLALAALALRQRVGPWRPWALLAAVCMVLALGPVLKVLGHSSFTPYQEPLLLPYAFLMGVPGFNFMRTPGQFMQLGLIAFGLLATWGLAEVVQRLPHRRRLIIGLALALLLFERWPRPWPMEALRPVPTFYQQLAQDREMYGVLDLPIQPRPEIWPFGYSSFYQMYQLVHRKGIAAGYLSRVYQQHPFLPELFKRCEIVPDLEVDGRPVNCYAAALPTLARLNYRYVVWHKPQPSYYEDKPGGPGEVEAQAALQQMFGATPPLHEDALTRVYAVPQGGTSETAPVTPALGQGWGPHEGTLRWATSPATIDIAALEAQQVWLELTPALLHNPTTGGPDGVEGRLQIESGPGISLSLPITLQVPRTIPLTLQPGMNTITLSLEAGNFVAGEPPTRRTLSFAVQKLNVLTALPAGLPADVSFGAPPQYRLHTAALSQTTISPTVPLRLQLAWEALQPISETHTLFLHLVDREGTIWGQLDEPLLAPEQPVEPWAPGIQLITEHELHMLAETPPGRYELRMGLYDRVTRARVIPITGSDGAPLPLSYHVLGEIDVQAEATEP